MSTEGETNAPLAACNDAIKHFDQAIEADSERIRKSMNHIREVEAAVKVLKAKRAQWITARDTLQGVEPE